MLQAIAALLAFVPLAQAGRSDEVSMDVPTLVGTVEPARRVIEQGQPIEVELTLTNPAPVGVVLDEAGWEGWQYVTLQWRFTPDVRDEVERVDSEVHVLGLVDTITCILGMPPVVLEPGAQMRRTATVAVRTRSAAERHDSASWAIPATSKPGTYRLALVAHSPAFRIESEVATVEVVPVDLEQHSVFRAFTDLQQLPSLFSARSPEPLDELESFLLRAPRSPYADLVRLRLAQRSLSWAQVEDEAFALEVTGKSSRRNLDTAAAWLGAIDAECFTRPRALAAIRLQLAATSERLAHHKSIAPGSLERLDEVRVAPDAPRAVGPLAHHRLGAAGVALGRGTERGQRDVDEAREVRVVAEDLDLEDL